MIKYSLCCESAHAFEGWFRNSDDFDRQCGLRLVTCPICGSADIRKSLMAPAVSTSRQKEAQMASASASSAERTSEAQPGAVSAPAPAVEQTALVAAHPRHTELLESFRKLRQKVIDSSDYVGKEFAKEARKIHYGEAEERNIYGETSKADVEALAEEGISVLPLPVLPDDQN